MKKNIFTQKTDNPSNLESVNWKNFWKEIEQKLGKDIYESWIKKLKLVEEFQHYIVFSSPTRFIRDWVVSRYLDKILEVIKSYKKSITRIDFVIDSELNTNKKDFVNQDQKIEKISSV